MKKLALAAALVLATAATSHAATIIDSATKGFYNAGIGSVLNSTSIAFPGVGDGDPTQSFGPGDAPDLSAAASALGDWLTTPATPGGTWSATEQAIPRNWKVNDETAVIYAFDGGANGIENLNLSIGVDNGIFVWLNGVFQGGAMAPGGARLGEFTLDLGTVQAGTNFLQLLREDHGGGTGYAIEVTGDEISAVPLPAGLPLLLAGLGIFGWMKRRAA
ncbi:VPLPA-CTERM sorting domain-containing protein [Roseobacter denitrificans]|uniref:VPLPA-CTERM protein sorting domain-containing protein n=1 Tax=Roseobacter denitrificans (strain ATCC 33942 / OCh 114) TaxID=375451 RepID=Q163U8_ROSDO|nr:VPLPA-CTERM sorting domain-containing protein [Roseobacter denitrificans]ABG32745.1 hypothetical protein RD1_3244 [Roseobacter denitrificans OCh 114]AVL52164.1 VPLPA-CTERM sorting domain-containing protein [Roseobacter denitrificans]SFF94468.1 VPLPA-CTERM protein sorting domain-containing protein [Roseobacter denitrificans OCh 114]